MRQLRFVKPGEDGDHLVLETADGNEQFVLYVDTALRDATRSDLPRLPSSTPEPEASIGPREIQVRVRAGESPQELAEANGMTLERVLRFAGPVLAERARIADESRRARARRSTTEGQTVIFGEAVDVRFGAHGIDPLAVRWDARRREDGQWVVSAHWVGGESERRAEWLFHLSGRNVSPLDDTAADLLSDRPIRPVTPPEPGPTTRPTLAAAPPLAPGVVAFPAMPHADTGPLPVVDDVFDQDALDDEPRDVGPNRTAQASRTVPVTQAVSAAPAASAASAAPRAVPRPSAGTGADAPVSAAGYDAPPLPLRLAEPVPAASATSVTDDDEHKTMPVPRVTNLGIAHRDDETDDEKAARAHIPSWDDILLGVRRKTD